MTQSIIFKITDYIERDLEWEKEECKKLGINFKSYKLKYSPAEEIINCVHDADIILVNMAKFTEKVIDSLSNTKVIIRHGIGYDNIDVQAATKNGIIFANEATASSEDVAEHAIMLIFETFKKKRIQNRILQDWIKTGKWSSEKIFPLYRLSGKTLGVVGCGNIGSRVFKKLSSFGIQLLVCDPYLHKRKFKRLDTKHVPFKKLLQSSDVITIHVPVTEETRGMFNSKAFALMKKSAILINTSRGPVVNTKDLIQALEEGQISGVGMDVFEDEPPPPDFPLLKMDNAILTPHIAWYSEEGGWDIRHMIMKDVQSILNGKLPRYVVNPEVLGSPNLRLKI